MQYIFFGHDFRYLELFENVRQSLVNKSEVKYVFSRWGPFYTSQNISGMQGRSWYLDTEKEAYRIEGDPNIDFKFYEMYNFDKAKMTVLFRKYVSKFMSILPETVPPFVLMPGEYRLSEQALKLALEMKFAGEAKVLYFESGPPGYIYFSPYGTNAKSNFDGLVADLVRSSNQAFGQELEVTKQYRVENRTLLQLIDYFHITINRFVKGRLDYQEYIQAIANFLQLQLQKLSLVRAKKNHDTSSLSPYSPIILYCGQVRSDVNHTHFGVTQEEVVSKLQQLLDKNNTAAVIVRHHPLYVNSSLENSLKNRFGDRVMKSTSSNIKYDIERSDGVVTVNSNSGIEALLLGKPVCLLGRSYYENLPGVANDLGSFLAMMNDKGAFAIKRAITEFLEKYFIKIDYRNGDFSNSRLASHVFENF